MIGTHGGPTASGGEPGCDVIGDVHGQRRMLERLLASMCYAWDGVTWRHPERVAVFVGDILDKGPDPAGCLRLVRGMVEAGSAHLVVGNHELNWIAATWRHLGHADAFMAGTHRHPCRVRLAAGYADDPEALMDAVAWLQRQPLWIERRDCRVIHACWHAPSLEVLRDEGITCLDEGAMARYRHTYSPVHLALDRLVAGAEHTFLPGQARSLRRRVHWWPGRMPAIHPVELSPQPASDPGYPADAPPVLFGHYAFDGPPAPLAANVMGLDYAAAHGGPLVACRITPCRALATGIVATLPETVT